MPKRQQMLRAQRRALLRIKGQAMYFCFRGNIKKQHRHRRGQLAYFFGIPIVERYVNQQPFHALGQQFLKCCLATFGMFHHRDQHACATLARAGFDRRGDLRRRMQRQIGGDQPQRAGAFPGELLRPAIGYVMQFTHRLLHLVTGARGDVFCIVNHARNGLVGNARQAGNVIQSDGFHISTSQREMPVFWHRPLVKACERFAN
ncbi:hypothetical protein D3C71_874630 [compost metagenome]